jgi:hypothetical protein
MLSEHLQEAPLIFLRKPCFRGGSYLKECRGKQSSSNSFPVFSPKPFETVRTAAGLADRRALGSGTPGAAPLSAEASASPYFLPPAIAPLLRRRHTGKTRALRHGRPRPRRVAYAALRSAPAARVLFASSLLSQCSSVERRPCAWTAWPSAPTSCAFAGLLLCASGRPLCCCARLLQRRGHASQLMANPATRRRVSRVPACTNTKSDLVPAVSAATTSVTTILESRHHRVLAD